MTNVKEYAFVLDAEGKQLSPMRIEKAWYKIRHNQAKLVNKYPMVVQLKLYQRMKSVKMKFVVGLMMAGFTLELHLFKDVRQRIKFF